MARRSPMLPNMQEIAADRDYNRMYQLGIASHEPAFFYRLRSRDYYVGCGSSRKSEAEFFELPSDDSYQNAKTTLGRIYNPPDRHTWNTNLVWVLGLVHRGRNVILNSKVLSYTLFNHHALDGRRQLPSQQPTNVNQCSAFVREIAAVMKAGYRPDITESGRLFLRAPSVEDGGQAKLNCADIDPSLQEVLEAVKQVILKLFHFVVGDQDTALQSYFENCDREPYFDYVTHDQRNDLKEAEQLDRQLKKDKTEDPTLFWEYYERVNIPGLLVETYGEGNFLEKKDVMELVTIASILSKKGLLYSNDDQNEVACLARGVFQAPSVVAVTQSAGDAELLQANSTMNSPAWLDSARTTQSVSATEEVVSTTVDEQVQPQSKVAPNPSN